MFVFSGGNICTPAKLLAASTAAKPRAKLPATLRQAPGNICEELGLLPVVLEVLSVPAVRS